MDRCLAHADLQFLEYCRICMICGFDYKPHNLPYVGREIYFKISPTISMNTQNMHFTQKTQKSVFQQTVGS